MQDINQHVLDAFHVEHREHLEAIRALMAEVAGHDAPIAESRLEEAFRRAHSMKGGARICALRPVESLGHRLETLFAQLQRGVVRCDRDVVRAVNLALDTTEDWMAALVNQQTPPETDAALAAIDQVLESGREPSPRPKVPPIVEQLRAAFQAEYQEYVAGIRIFLAKVSAAPHDVGEGALAEAFRMAHSLKGAARVAEFAEVERISERLETLFARVRAGTFTLDEQTRESIEADLRGIEAAMAAATRSSQPGAAPACPDTSDALPGAEAASADGAARTSSGAPSAAAPAQLETVRVATASLDHLVRSAGQLHGESVRQHQLARALDQLGRQIEDMQRERESLRKMAGASLHQLSARPEFTRISRYLDSVDTQIRELASRIRSVRLTQRRSAWQLAALGQQVQHDVEQTRVAPAESVFQGFRKMVRDLARDEGKQVEFRMTGLDVLADRMVLQALKDPLMHILRNAVTHGIERVEGRAQRGKDPTGRIELTLDALGNRLRVVVADDGAGIDVASVAELAARRGLVTAEQVADRSPDELARLVFHPGFSTSKTVTELSGRGIGLSVVNEAVNRLQGEVQIRPQPGVGAAVEISVPLSISTHRLLRVACGNQEFAIPLHAVERLLRQKAAEVETVEGKAVVNLERELAPLVNLADLLGIVETTPAAASENLQIVVLRAGSRRLAITVDACLGEHDSLIHELDPLSASVQRFAGGILLEDGRVALVIHPARLIDDFKPSHRAPAAAVHRQAARRSVVLVVDDSFTTRTLEKTLLESHGYEVRIAVDGAEALAQLEDEEHGIDLVITDVQMPRLDGFGLLAEIKRNERLSSLPVILVTSLDNPQDQERGLSLGADAYIVKRKFDHEDLLATIRQII
ncbi:MAG TPA: response regulator [Pirellulales bacterium]|nr:response regulator [Pirellulales bacterium]